MADDQELPLSNGVSIPSDPDDLLAVLSEETVGKSYGYVSVKLTQGEEVRKVRLKIRPIDVLDLASKIDKLSDKDKKRVLEETSKVRSVGFTDDTWMQSLAAFVYGLAPPHVLKIGKETVWVADGEPQKLVDAMIAVIKIGFDYWHVNDVSNAVTELTRDRSDEAFAGN